MSRKLRIVNPIFALLPSEIRELLTIKNWWQDIPLAMNAFRQLHELDSLSTKEGDNIIRLPKGLNHGVFTHGLVLNSSGNEIYPGCAFFGTVIVGPNCRVGPNTSIWGPTVIESNAIIGPNAEIRRSIIFSGVKISHMAYVGHSIVGRNVNIGANLVIAVRNLKRNTVHLKIGRRLIDTRETHFGAIIADGVEFGINVSIMPGRIIATKDPIPPNSIIMQNIIQTTTRYNKKNSNVGS